MKRDPRSGLVWFPSSHHLSTPFTHLMAGKDEDDDDDDAATPFYIQRLESLFQPKKGWRVEGGLQLES